MILLKYKYDSHGKIYSHLCNLLSHTYYKIHKVKRGCNPGQLCLPMVGVVWCSCRPDAHCNSERGCTQCFMRGPPLHSRKVHNIDSQHKIDLWFESRHWHDISCNQAVVSVKVHRAVSVGLQPTTFLQLSTTGCSKNINKLFHINNNLI